MVTDTMLETPGTEVLVRALGLSPAFEALLCDQDFVRFGTESVDLDQRLLAEGISADLLVSTSQGPRVWIRPRPWVRGYLSGELVLDSDVEALRVPVPALNGELSVRLESVLADRSRVIEIVAPKGSLVECDAAGAIVRGARTPLMFNLAGVELDHALEVVRSFGPQARTLGFGTIFIGNDAVVAEREFIGAVQALGVPAVLISEARTRAHTPTAPFVALESHLGDRSKRVLAWERIAQGDGFAPSEAALDALSRLPLSVVEMYEVVVRAASAAALLDDPLSLDQMVSHGREVLMTGMSGLARVRTPKISLDGLVYPADVRTSVDDVARACRTLMARPYEDRAGLRMLFTGPSGTGKTAAIEAIGHELGIPLLFVETSRVVDKYIGETEKNLDKVLQEAERAGAMLVFDEGEALFGSRKNASDSSGGAEGSNRQTAYLLARIEQHDGLVAVISNFPGAIDGAFLRRFHFTVTFPLPAGSDRVALWERMLERHGITESVDPGMWSEYELSGGNIANICFLASLLLPGAQVPAQELINDLVRKEYARLGRRPLS